MHDSHLSWTKKFAKHTEDTALKFKFHPYSSTSIILKYLGSELWAVLKKVRGQRDGVSKAGVQQAAADSWGSRT